jgi:O-antigen ligase
VVVIWTGHLVNHRYAGILAALSALAVLNAFRNYRSMALIAFITALYSVFQMSQAGNRQPRKAGRLRLAILGLMVACGIWAFTQIYSHYVEQGVFGEYAQRKLEAQRDGEGGILLGGRGEILASGQAIIDSPFIGHGSWARDPTYAAILADKRAELGYKSLNGQAGKRDDLIPSHSHIFGAWVESGLAGGLFWLFVLVFTIRSLIKVSGSEPLLPVFAFTGFQLTWDILFSPLGMPTRFMTPFCVVAMVLLASFRERPVLGETF